MTAFEYGSGLISIVVGLGVARVEMLAELLARTAHAMNEEQVAGFDLLHTACAWLDPATEVEVVPGFIALQSEGGEIHFRSVKIWPID